MIIATTALMMGAVGGYLYATTGEQRVATPTNFGREVTLKSDSACRSPSYAAIFEFGPSTHALAARGTDEVAIRIDQARKTLFMATIAGIGVGLIDPSPHPIVFSDDDFVVSITLERDTIAHVLRFDRKNELLMWSKNSQALGLVG